ncbi:polysaccharide deacetylase family protein [Paenibacillus gorillae]|uniref:polysaccharide deacetylase family protein n=1 Tax=Paenibacillus gorillae TaxID=1243662 RepID=UPI0004BB5777|nr:polysaccharide deacetylase family protein [Paenibacillus gorillae]
MKAIAALLVIALAIVWPVSASQLNASSSYYKNKVIVLMYHHIDTKESGATISPSRFGTHMKLLKENGYNVISVEQFADFMQKKRTVPDNAVVITFDDGYESFNQYAVPIMKKYNFTATHFIIGASSDKQNVHTKHLSWDTMRKLKEEGFSFYSHTYDLHNYAELNESGSKKGPMLSNRIYLKDKKRLETKAEYIARVKEDISLIEGKLKDELDNKYQMIAFPFGSFNSTVKKLQKEQGVSLFFTTRPGINKAGSDEVFRINAGSPKITGNKFLESLRKFH